MEDQAREETGTQSRSFSDGQQDRGPNKGGGSTSLGLQSHWIS